MIKCLCLCIYFHQQGIARSLEGGSVDPEVIKIYCTTVISMQVECLK
jgi:hypothetical protein